MPRTRTATTFKLDPTKLPTLGSDSGLTAETRTVKCGNGKTENVVFYRITTKAGLSALMNAGLAHFPTELKVGDKVTNPRQTAQESLLFNAVAAYVNGQAAAGARVKNADPIASLLGVARKRLELAKQEGVQHVLAIYAEGEARVSLAVRNLAQRMYDAREERRRKEAETLASV